MERVQLCIQLRRKRTQKKNSRDSTKKVFIPWTSIRMYLQKSSRDCRGKACYFLHPQTSLVLAPHTLTLTSHQCLGPLHTYELAQNQYIPLGFSLSASDFLMLIHCCPDHERKLGYIKIIWLPKIFNIGYYLGTFFETHNK